MFKLFFPYFIFLINSESISLIYIKKVGVVVVECKWVNFWGKGMESSHLGYTNNTHLLFDTIDV